MIITLIRHGMTAGNLQKRYIGVTDEPLCPEGIETLKRKAEVIQQKGNVLTKKDIEADQQFYYGQLDQVYASPMMRCRQTAELLYPDWKDRMILVPEFRECDFGNFENKNYLELQDQQEYQDWIDSGGMLPFPGGESQEQFRSRCCRGFEQVVDEGFSRDWKTMALVVHGGTIMSIMEQYAKPHRDYFDWQVKNGCGFQVMLQKENWEQGKNFETWKEL